MSVPFSMVPDLTPFIAPGVFYGLAFLAIVASIVAATAPKIVHAAFGLMAAFFGVAYLSELRPPGPNTLRWEREFGLVISAMGAIGSLWSLVGLRLSSSRVASRVRPASSQHHAVR